jgi:hypothetical protein
MEAELSSDWGILPELQSTADAQGPNLRARVGVSLTEVFHDRRLTIRLYLPLLLQGGGRLSPDGEATPTGLPPVSWPLRQSSP